MAINKEKKHLEFALLSGCEICTLGIKEMPEGYELLRDEEGWYTWIREDGKESAVTWDRWACYRNAVEVARGEKR